MSIEWFAGLYEGEGCIVRQPRNSLYLTISSTDLDVLEKAQSIVGGKVKGPRHDGNPLHKPRWEWYVSSRNEVLRITAAIYPHLCTRRRAQIDRALDGLSELPERRKLTQAPSCGYMNPGEKSNRGAHRHVRRGEAPCSECAEAQRLYNRKWRNQIKEQIHER